MKQNNKQKQLIVVILVIILVFSICVFCIPFKKGGTFWIAYIAELLAFILQVPLFRPAGKNAAKLKSKALGMPIYSAGLLYLGIQTAVSLILFIFGAVSDSFPVWISAALCVIILAGAFLGSITAESSEKRGYARKKSVMESMCIKAQNITMKAYDENSRNMLELVTESIRYSDPDGNENTREIEQRLRSIVSQLDKAVSDKEDIVELCAEIAELLNKRNEICKMSSKF